MSSSTRQLKVCFSLRSVSLIELRVDSLESVSLRIFKSFLCFSFNSFKESFKDEAFALSVSSKTNALSFSILIFFSSSLVATSPSSKDAGSGWWMEPHTGHGVPTSSVLASKPACASRKSLLASS